MKLEKVNMSYKEIKISPKVKVKAQNLICFSPKPIIFEKKCNMKFRISLITILCFSLQFFGQIESFNYKRELSDRYQIDFDHLLCITNIPIKRYATYLNKRGMLDDYMRLLADHFNPNAARGVMCGVHAG